MLVLSLQILKIKVISRKHNLNIFEELENWP